MRDPVEQPAYAESAEALETLKEVDCLAVDKPRTSPKTSNVSGCTDCSGQMNHPHSQVGSLEQASKHPLVAAIVAAARRSESSHERTERFSFLCQ